jgi:TolB-like protein/DNA-binding winged helix-turn-helix (wHTH) protein/tetratricopeptide (TPR) repeat protein
MTSPQAKPTLAFGPFQLDVSRRILTRSGELVPLEPKVIETLVVLVEGDGRLVSKDELLERVWPDTFVEEGSLSRNVSTLRKALGDRQGLDEYIETVPKRGYRFRATIRTGEFMSPVVATADNAQGPGDAAAQQETTRPEEAPAGTQPEPDSRPSWSLRMPTWLWVATVLLVAALVGIALRRAPAAESEAGFREFRSLAVLPIQNLSGDPELEFVADGTTEELISSLSQVRSLRVIARTSVMAYKASTKTAAAIARELGVDAVLEGAVRGSGERLRITTQLVDAASDSSVWSKTHDTSVGDLLTVQGEIARAVTGVIVQDDPSRSARLSRPRATNPAAFEEILKGHAFRWRDLEADVRRSIAHYTRAIEIEPESAVAHAGLALAWNRLGNPSGIDSARAAASRALALDPDLPEAHAAMAASYYRDHEWELGHQESRRALALSHGSLDGCYCLAVALAWTGRERDALAVADDSVARNPRAAGAHEIRGLALYWGRRYEASIPSFRRALELDPAAIPSRVFLAQALAILKKGDEAVSQLDVPGLRRSTFMAIVKLYSGRRDEAVAIMRDMTSANPPAESIFLASGYAALGDTERTLSWLTRSIDSRETRAAVVIDELYDSVRSDPRFEAMVKRLKMPPSYYQFLRDKSRTVSGSSPD